MSISRFGVSLDEDVFKALDSYVIENNFANRSQAIRHIVEETVVLKKWRCNNNVAGAVILLYPHHKRDITIKLNKIQHQYFDVVLSSQHFHLSHDNCLEIIAVKGKAIRLTELSDKLIGTKGINHGKLVMSKTE